MSNHMSICQRYSSERDCKYDDLLWKLKVETKIPIWLIFQELVSRTLDNTKEFEKFKLDLIKLQEMR